MDFLNLKEKYTICTIGLNEKNPLQNTSFQVASNKKSLLKKSVLTVGLTTICFFGIENFAFASDFNAKAEALYFGKFIAIAKWVIIGKGGWDTLNKALKEDFDGAKKSFLQYAIVFATLLLLPTALNSVEDIIKG